MYLLKHGRSLRRLRLENTATKARVSAAGQGSSKSIYCRTALRITRAEAWYNKAQRKKTRPAFCLRVGEGQVASDAHRI